MPNFFGYFMPKQAFRNCYVQIEAENMEQARRAMFDHFGAEFMTVEDKESFLKWARNSVTGLQFIQTEGFYKPIKRHIQAVDDNKKMVCSLSLLCAIRVEPVTYEASGLPVYTLYYPHIDSDNVVGINETGFVIIDLPHFTD